MLTTKINYEVDEAGNRIETHSNTYADLLSNDISRYSLECPLGRPAYYITEIEIGIIEQPNKEKLVDIISVNNACCFHYTNLLHRGLKTDSKF